MAGEPRAWDRASVRLRTTVAAVLVVAVVLAVAAVTLVALVRSSLRDGLEATADERASTLAEQVESAGPAAVAADGDRPDDDPDDDPDDADDDLGELVWQVTDPSGAVVASSPSLPRALPADDADEVRLGEATYLVVTEDAEHDGQEHVVSVAASTEDVEESTQALVGPLALGGPLVLLLLGATTWLVVTRALAPVERIRREVDRITGDRLDRRVPEPPSQDEVHRLARTMNAMLGRLETASERQRRFVADASHELRSPLASIRQTAEVAQAHPHALPEGELAEAVLEESARMQRLVDQLLLLTRTDEGVLDRDHEVDLDDLALDAAARARRTGRVVDTSGVTACRARGDGGALAQVVRNLVDNAVRHAGGRVAVTVRRADDPAGGWAELVVEDDGPGVPEGDRGRVFERFVRLDEARARDAGGSGLGLAIVHEIVVAHGGSVTVSGSDLGGARFVVRLPPADAAPPG